jgi:hypothetical protein
MQVADLDGGIRGLSDVILYRTRPNATDGCRDKVKALSLQRNVIK